MYEKLLYEDECNYIDFKKEQYKFIGEKDINVKCELLKDVLAFANSWASGPRYILIGVMDTKQNKAKVVGIDSHIDDANLQEFINKNTNVPVDFSYSKVKCEDLPIGVIKINPCNRPVYLKKNVGYLKKNTVYYRRGSSTFTANPSEIAHMGAHEERKKDLPSFEIGFYDHESGNKLGLNHNVELFTDRTIPEAETLPDFKGNKKYRQRQEFGIAGYLSNDRPNKNYLRDEIKWVQSNTAIVKLRFYIKNLSDILAKNINITFNIPNHKFRIISTSDLLQRPMQMESFNDSLSLFANNQTTDISDIYFENFKQKQKVSIDFGDIQPKNTNMLHEDLLIQVFRPLPSSLIIEFDLLINGDNVDTPQKHNLVVNVTVEDIDSKWQDWLEL